MRFFSAFILCTISSIAFAQLDPVTEGVYVWADHPVKKEKERETRSILEGTSSHFDYLEIHATTQYQGAVPRPGHANEDFEEVIIVKEGQMKITIEGESKMLGPQGVIVLLPRNNHTIENIGDGPLTYYVMKYRAKAPKDIDRGVNGGGSMMIKADDLTFKESQRGGGIAYFDRPTAMCERFEMHVTHLKRKGPSHKPHEHKETEIILILSGQTSMVIDGITYSAGPGDFYFIPAFLNHGISNATDEACSYFAFKWK